MSQTTFKKGGLYVGPFTSNEIREALGEAVGALCYKKGGEWLRSCFSTEISSDVEKIFVSPTHGTTTEDATIVENRSGATPLEQVVKAIGDMSAPRQVLLPSVVSAMRVAKTFCLTHAWIIVTTSVAVHLLLSAYIVVKVWHSLFPGFPDITTAVAEAVR